MSSRQWNTVAERDILVSLVDLCMKILDEDDDIDFNDLGLDVDLTIWILSPSTRLNCSTNCGPDDFSMNWTSCLAYGQYILQDLESNIDLKESVLMMFASARMI
jgi:hypothetical protein